MIIADCRPEGDRHRSTLIDFWIIRLESTDKCDNGLELFGIFENAFAKNILFVDSTKFWDNRNDACSSINLRSLRLERVFG